MFHVPRAIRCFAQRWGIRRTGRGSSIDHARVPDMLDHLLGGRLRSVINHNDLDRDTLLVERAGDSFQKLVGTTKGRNNDGEINRQSCLPML